MTDKHVFVTEVRIDGLVDLRTKLQLHCKRNKTKINVN